MHISQAKAFDMLRAETGKSKAACKERVDALPKHSDGKRKKVLLSDVKRVIEIINNPLQATVARGGKPIRSKHLSAAIRV